MRRRKTKSRTSATRQPEPRSNKVRFITPAEARQRAERHVIERMFKGALVQDGAKVRLGMYFRGGWTARDVWVVYMNPEEVALKSSKVVLVCKRTGQVLYEGPAQDEG
jgi:hypothetical protein